MKLDPSTLSTLPGLGAGEARLASFSGGDAWADNLTLGQILQGKVLRSYGEGRYAVDLGGQERIVDSGVPLAMGDVLRGRIVGLSQRVTVERLPERIPVSPSIDEVALRSASAARKGDAVQQTAEKLHLKIGAGDAPTIESIARGLPDVELAIRIGLFVAKLGLPVSAELVQALYERMVFVPQSFESRPGDSRPILNFTDRKPETWPESTSEFASIEALASWFASDGQAECPSVFSGSSERAFCNESSSSQGAAMEASGAAGDDARQSTDSDREFLPSPILSAALNIQTGARLQHRFRTLPVVVGGRLLEFDLALFDHLPADHGGVRSKRIHFSLTTEQGELDVDATTLDNRVEIAFSSNRRTLLDSLQDYSRALAEALQLHGWLMEGSQYRHDRPPGPAHSIVEHVLAQDSLQVAL